MNKESVQKGLITIAQVAWVLGAFLGASYLLGVLLLTYETTATVQWLVTNPVGILALYALSDLLVGAVVFIPFYLRQLSWGQIRSRIGLKMPTGRYVFVSALFVWGLYFASSAALVVLLYSLHIPGLDLQQKQNIGFSTSMGGSVVGYVAAFLALVVAAPILEEIIFRGYLFGRLRKTSSFVVSAILTSAVFAYLHGQLNVAIDVFVLSLFLCWLRNKFDSIWPGVIVHAFKNGLAYTLLFILPLYGINLIK